MLLLFIEKRNKMKIYCYFFLMFLILSVSCSSLSDNKGSENAFLRFKTVIDDPKIKPNSKYEHGKELYPKYSYQGLSDSFLIKKSADITIASNEIESIEIKKMPYVPANMLQFTVILFFKNDAAKKLHSYTKGKINERVALEIGVKIYFIALIIEPIEREMNITVANRTLEEITSDFAKVSKKIHYIEVSE